MTMDFYTFIILLITVPSVIVFMYFMAYILYYSVKRRYNYKNKHLNILNKTGISYKEVKKQLKAIDSDLGIQNVSSKQIINTANNLAKFRKSS